jgi:hypothetical protein
MLRINQFEKNVNPSYRGGQVHVVYTNTRNITGKEQRANCLRANKHRKHVENRLSNKSQRSTPPTAHGSSPPLPPQSGRYALFVVTWSPCPAMSQHNGVLEAALHPRWRSACPRSSALQGSPIRGHPRLRVAVSTAHPRIALRLLFHYVCCMGRDRVHLVRWSLSHPLVPIIPAPDDG